MFLPEGLELVEVEDQIVPCTIVQAEDDGPSFVVDVRILPIKEYRQVYSKLNNQETTGGFRKTNTLQDKIDKDYLERVVKGWRGLTIANWEAIVRSDKKIGGAKYEELKKKGYEIEFSQEASFYLYRNTWPQMYGNKIFEVIQEGAEAQEEDEANLKKA